MATTEGNQGRSAPIQCLVARDLPVPELAALSAHFGDCETVSIQVDRRVADRRRSGERREGHVRRQRAERRAVRNRGGRRVADRRRPARRARQHPALPGGLLRDPSKVRFEHRGLQSIQAAEEIEALRLVARFQAGDARAFCQLYEIYFDRLYGYLLTALRDRHEAEDAAQEVFIRVLRGLPRYEFRGSPFEAWLFRIARNYSINHHERAAPVAPEDPVALDRRRERWDPAALEWMSDGDLLAFVGRLPLPQRQVVVLRYMVGLDWETIAAIMDRTPGAARQLEQRAFGTLRGRLEAVRGGAAEQGRQRFAMRRLTFAAPVTSARRGALRLGAYAA